MNQEVTNSDRSRIVHEIQKGEFWKPCPGTAGGYLCCGYQIITPMTGCGMYCRYCILQSYFNCEYRVVYDNFNDLENEVRSKLEKRKGIIRFGTGEFADSLHAEEQTGISVKVAELLEPYPDVIVEFKTKSAVVEPLRKIRTPGKVIVAFSLNSPRMVEVMERTTAPLEQRFAAAKKALSMGFKVAFHFDPIFYYEGWEQEYTGIVDRIYETVDDVSKIAWISMGGFRTTPLLKLSLKEKNAHLPLFSGEMITGNDGKLRYFRPIRTEIYKGMQKAFYQYQSDAPIYLCMESPEVWRDSGMINRIPKGLPTYLDERARSLLYPDP